MTAALETVRPGSGGAATCPNCGTAHDSAYCPACGQHREAARLLPLRTLAAETTGEILSLDSRVARTLKLLLLHPGEATLRYLAGQRQPHVPPLRLYLVVSAVSIFLMAVTGYLSLEFLLSADPEEVAEMVRLMGGDPDDPLFIERFGSAYATVFPITNLFSPVLFALALKAVYPRRYLHAHFVFALHAWTAVNVVGTPILLSLRAIGRVAALLLLLYLALYMYLAQRRVYDEDRRGIRILKFGALLVMVMIAIELIASAAFFSAILLARWG